MKVELKLTEEEFRLACQVACAHMIGPGDGAGTMCFGPALVLAALDVSQALAAVRGDGLSAVDRKREEEEPNEKDFERNVMLRRALGGEYTVKTGDWTPTEDSRDRTPSR